MRRSQTCDHPADGPLEDSRPRIRKCGKRAAVEVRYLGDIDYLCASHHEEASRWNTYQADEVGT